MRPPLIGITRCSKMDDYVASVERTGARVRVLEVSDSPRALVAEIDGLVLTGGGDVDPVFYGEDRHSETHDAEPGRDEFEIDLARRALDADLPLLAICRGAQVLNVAGGGTLVQDIPSKIASDIQHTIDQPKDAVAHDVTIVQGSVLERALGPAVDAGHLCRVNSRHHQSVARLGRGFISSAASPDGVIEAIESPASRFCVGVQWHPENFCRTGEFAPLFESFVTAARERLASRAEASTRADADE